MKKEGTHGVFKQVRYQFTNAGNVSKSRYFNSSIFDTLSGEYYRSFTDKSDYYHVFDYWRWDETVIDKTLRLYDGISPGYQNHLAYW